MSATRIAGVLGLFAVLQAAATAAPATCNTTERCIAMVAHTQDPRVADALRHVPAIGAKLLALRAYLRAGATLGLRWSWDDAQIAAFAGSVHEAQLDAAIAAVRVAFERANPGYTLTVNPEVRSLDRQLAAWNANASVAAAGRGFAAAIDAALHASGTPPAGVSPAQFAQLVMAHQPQPTPTLAAPGLSRHGQMYAVDFHVLRGAAAVAEPDSTTVESIWVGQGWERRLRAAVAASGSAFTGPLQDPHEPWHYDYAVPGMPQPRG